MGPVVRAAGVRGLAALVDELGGDGRALFARFGLGDPDDDERLVPLLQVNAALETAARELGCPDLGLRLAGRQDHTVLGPLAVALESAVTVRDAVESVSRFMFVHSDAISIEIGPDPGGSPTLFGLYYRVHVPGVVLPGVQGLDLGVGIVHRIYALIRSGEDGGYPLRGVDLPHRPAAPIGRYEEFFGVRPRFGRPVAALRLPTSELGFRSEGSSALVHALAVAHLERTYTRPDPGTVERVRAVLAESLGTPTATLTGVARLLLLHPRTLQRRLADEGTGFDAVLDDVRRERARHLVGGTDLPLTQVAAMLGYAHQAALTRAVRRWFGTSPRALRATRGVVRGKEVVARR